MKASLLKRASWAALVSLCAVGGSIMAAPATVPDFSFENEPLSPGANTIAPDVGTNWSASGNGGVYVQNITNTLFTATVGGTLPPTADGTNYLVENMNGHTAYCWQDVGLLQSNTVYTLTIAVGQSLLGFTGTGEIMLINGTSPFAKVLGSVPVDNSVLTAGTFVDSTIVFTNGYQSSGDLTLLMQGDSTGAQLLFDNVRLDATATPAAATALPPSYSSPSTTVYQGTQVTLSENPAGALPFTYQWLTDNGSGGVTFTPIAGATNINYIVDTTGFTPGTPVEYAVTVANTSGSSTSGPVTLNAITGAPVILQDTLPSSGSSETVGGTVTFTASFDGSRPIAYQWQFNGGNIDGATNSTLTLTNVQLSDSGSYNLVATNLLGVTSSTPSSFTVNPVPADVNGVVTSPANQVGLGGSTDFSPTWMLATNSLIAGVLPTISVGDFQEEGSGGIVPLTDGRFGTLYPEGNASADLGTCGVSSSGAGSVLAYTLPASATGWDITNIVVYGGWSDNGRDQQRYQVYYSTTANPTNYANLLADVNYDPGSPNGIQSATRVSVTDTNGVLAKNVAGIEFYFNTLASGPKNSWEGYAEMQVFGVHSAPLPVLATNISPASGSDEEGGQVVISAAFTGSGITYQWTKDGTPIPGATNSTLVLNNLQISDTAVNPGYVLVAQNASGSVSSSPCAFTVNPAVAPDGSGIIISPANQTGNSAVFSPTWSLAPGSLIAGMDPIGITTGGGTFANEGAGSVAILTDGSIGHVGGGDNSALATAGNGGAGHTITYNLPATATYGFDITNIVLYGGWSDGGRNQQGYTVYYATASSPANFVALDSVYYAPTIPGAVPNMTRVSLTPASGPMAVNVVAIMIDFTSPATENGYEGYSEIQVFGTPSAAVTYAPSLVADTLPATGADVVGSQVTFTANFAGTPPLAYQWQKDGNPILNATNATLTISNLQPGDAGSYNVTVTNIYGSASSTPNTFTVNPAPTPTGAILATPANQTGYASVGFTPTWTAASGSLIAGKAPSAVGSGNFNTEGCGGVNFLTDGDVGTFLAGNFNLASCGTGAGTSVTYALPVSASGYDLNEIAVYAGWADNGRDGQGYVVSYSTAANPGTFIALTTNSFNPTVAGGVPSADRLTLTAAAGGAMAKKVAYVQFTFLNVENGWSGYSEIQVFGVPSTGRPSINPPTVSGNNLVLAGSGGAPGSGYTLLTTTNLTLPLSEWTTNVSGTFDSNGMFSNGIPITTTSPQQFFLLRAP